MDIRHLILTTLTVTLAPGCTSVWNCNPDSDTFSLDEDVLAADIEVIIEGWGVESVEDIECRTVCDVVFSRDSSWEINPESCAMDLSGYTDDSESTEVVGSVTCSGSSFEYYCEGRRPLGHVEAAGGGGELADYLVRCAHLESASVVAFTQLARQLSAWGAPAALVARCEVAAAEEQRHAEAVAALIPETPALSLVCEAADESLLAVALHNATEGCVMEAWAALTARLKADHAEDATIRQAYRQIAEDEAGHASLAWDLHRWLCAQLSASQRAMVQAAQEAALSQLPMVARGQAEHLPAGLGLPAPDVAAELARRFATGLAA